MGSTMGHDSPSSQEDLFAAAASLTGAQRSAFLDLHCSARPDLRADLESLLRAHDAAEAFLESPAVRVRSSDDAPPDPGGMSYPERIGAYAISGILGIGGMGTVYLARQEGTSRDVALKVMRPGYASASMRRRFEHEARMLARLHHPGIAQIYEAGIADVGGGPQPYFAMELVKGKSVTTFAKDSNLDIRGRLELMAAIADAVEHAHSRGIIHRDLKPANVLVDRDGHPRVLDFGVARATSADLAVSTLHTQPGQLIGTLAYMSPEQIAGDPGAIDGRCDVYALGVMLYELLAGRLPHDSADTPLPEMLRRIREVEASPLSTVDAVYRGDVETIVRKAMEKDPERRYQSAAAMAEDLRRHLRHEPILARPPGRIEQARKFVRRNRILVGATTVVFVSLILLIVGVSVSLVRARDAERIALIESANARKEAVHAEAVSRFLQEMLAGVDPAFARSADTTLLRQILDIAANRVHELEDTPEVEAAIRTTIGGTYMFAGQNAQADEHLRRAYELRRQVLGENDPETLRTANRLGGLHKKSGRLEEAEAVYRSVLAARRELFGDHHAATLESVSNLGSLYIEMGRPADAEPLCIEAVEGRRQLLGDEHPETLESLANLGLLYWAQGRRAEIEPIWTSVLDARLRVHGEEHPATLSAMHNLAFLYDLTGRVAEAEPILLRLLDLRRRIQGLEHPDTLRAMNNLAAALIKLDRGEEAEVILEELMAILPRVQGASHYETLVLMTSLASRHLVRGRAQEAESLLDQVVHQARIALPDGHWYIGVFLSGRANARAALGRYPEAEADLLEAHDILKVSLPQDDNRIVAVITTLVKLYEAWDRGEQAAMWRAHLPASGP